MNFVRMILILQHDKPIDLTVGRQSTSVYFPITLATFAFALAVIFSDEQNKFRFRWQVSVYCQIISVL